MRKSTSIIFLIIASLTLASAGPGCGGDENSLQGVWTFDYDASEGAIEAVIDFQDFDQVQAGFFRNLMRHGSVEYKGDTYITHFNGRIIEKDPVTYEKNSDGTWTVCYRTYGCETVRFLSKNRIRSENPLGLVYYLDRSS